MFLLAAVPAVIVVLARRTIPETPGFLLSRGRVDEANASARWISGTDAVGEAAEPVTRPLRELVGPRYLRATMLAWLLWFSWSFSYFGITLWLPTLLVLAGVPLSHVLLYAVGFQLAAIAGRAVMLPVAGRFGPRPVIILMAAGAAGAVLWFGTLPGTVLLVVAGSLLSCCQDGGFSGIVPFTPDLYPVRLRATGVGAANGAGRLASLLAPLLVGALAESGDIHPVFVIFAAGYGLAALAAFCLGSWVVPVASGSGSRSGRGRG